MSLFSPFFMTIEIVKLVIIEFRYSIQFFPSSFLSSSLLLLLLHYAPLNIIPTFIQIADLQNQISQQATQSRENEAYFQVVILFLLICVQINTWFFCCFKILFNTFSFLLGEIKDIEI